MSDLSGNVEYTGGTDITARKILMGKPGSCLQMRRRAKKVSGNVIIQSEIRMAWQRYGNQ
jgi:hypothetical protein